MTELHSIEPLITPNSVTLLRGYDSAGQRWSFLEEDRDTPANYFASTTGILDIFIPRQLKEWWVKTAPDEIAKKSGAAMERGNKIHEALAQGRKPKAIGDRLGPVEVAELSVYSPHYGYAGTLDGIRPIDGIRTIPDYKSGRNYGIKTGWQLAAYRMAYAELMGEYLPIAGVHLPPGGEQARIFKYEHVDFCWLAFLSCFQIWKSLNYNSLKRMGWKWLNEQVVEVANA